MSAPLRPREHWLLLAAALTTVFVAMFVQGYAHHTIQGSSTVTDDRSAEVPAMNEVGPVLDLAEGEIRSMAVPAKTIALTFDDGPDARWTPKILDLLARYHVPATFFVVGSRVVESPGLVRRMIAAGDDVGNHTFTHTNLTAASSTLSRLELRLTQMALATAIGRHTVLLRPPYSSEANAVHVDTLRAWRSVTADGYLVVLSDLDGKDWEPGLSVQQIVANASPVADKGGILLLHDGGGDRSRTVAALESIIPTLQARGYRFVTVSSIAGLTPDAVMPRVGTVTTVQSWALPVAIKAGDWLARVFTVLAVLIAALAVVRSLLLVVFARRHVAAVEPVDPGFVPSVSILVPAYNESAGVAASVRSLAASNFGGVFEVVVIDDGSTDETARIVSELIADDGLAHVRVISQPNGGKAAALNTGLRAAQGDIIVTVDGDTVFEPDALTYLVQPFKDAAVGAVSGNTKVANRKGLLGRWQHLEYVMGFNLDRRLYDRWRCMPTVPGAIGAFRAPALREVEGFSTDTLAEDTDVTMSLHRAGWTVAYEGRAIAWTEAPSGLRDLWRQRYRWSYGTMQSVWKHKHAIVERGHAGRFGRIGIGYLVLFQVGLAMIAPVVDVFTLYGVAFLNPWTMLAYWLGFTLLQTMVAGYALWLDGEHVRDVWALPLQQFVYRQLMYLVVIQSVATAAFGARTGWQKLRRAGIGTVTP